MLLIFMAGTYDSYLKSIKYKLNAILIWGSLMHTIGLYPLTNIKKYIRPNIINYLTSILGAFIILFLPYWPYEVSRKFVLSMLIMINVFFTGYYYLRY